MTNVFEAVVAFVVSLTLASAHTCGETGDDAILIKYRAQNTRAEAGEVFTADQDVYVLPGATTFDMMLVAEGCNSQMNLNYTCFDGLGAYITAINDVYDNVEQELFWAFMHQNSSGLCLHNYGVSTHIPVENEQVIFSMEYYSIFEELPNCETGMSEPHHTQKGGAGPRRVRCDTKR